MAVVTVIAPAPISETMMNGLVPRSTKVGVMLCGGRLRGDASKHLDLGIDHDNQNRI
jgi:hypothetical protein